MNPIAILLLAASLTTPAPALVLRSGVRIPVDGPITIEEKTILFRSGGALYSIPAEEVDLEATRAMTAAGEAPLPNQGRLRVSSEERDRLLRELQENHSGTPAPPEALALPPVSASAPERATASRDEWTWKQQARGYEELVRRAQENLDLLRQKAERLRSRIAGLFQLGYKPDQFTYDTTQLAYTEERIPNAELAVTRAQRAYDQFLDDARRQGVPPGWLR